MPGLELYQAFLSSLLSKRTNTVADSKELRAWIALYKSIKVPFDLSSFVTLNSKRDVAWLIENKLFFIISNYSTFF